MNQLIKFLLTLVLVIIPGLSFPELIDIKFYKANMFTKHSVNATDDGIYGYYEPVHGSQLFYPVSTNTPWISPDKYIQKKIRITLENNINEVIINNTRLCRIVPAACVDLIDADDNIHSNIVISDLSTYDSLPLQDRTPIVLVHGWQPLHNNVVNMIAHHPEYETWLKFRTYLINQHQNQFKVFQFRYPSFKHINTNGGFLADAIRSDSELKNRDDIIIIGHSMGGLVAKSAMFEYDLNEQIYKLITLATPHHGVIGVDAKGEFGVTYSLIIELIQKGLSNAMALIGTQALKSAGVAIVPRDSIEYVTDHASEKILESFQEYYLTTESIKDLSFDGLWTYGVSPCHVQNMKLVSFLNDIKSMVDLLDIPNPDSKIIYLGEKVSNNGIYGGVYDYNSWLSNVNQKYAREIYDKTFFYGGKLAHLNEYQLNKNILLSPLGEMLHLESCLDNDGIVPVESAFFIPDNIDFKTKIAKTDGIKSHFGTFPVGNDMFLRYRYFYDYDHHQMVNDVDAYDKNALNNLPGNPLFDQIISDLTYLRDSIQNPSYDYSKPLIYTEGRFKNIDIKKGSSISLEGKVISSVGKLSKVTAVITLPVPLSDGSRHKNLSTDYLNSSSFDLSSFIFDTAVFNQEGVHRVGIWAKSAQVTDPQKPLVVFSITVIHDDEKPLITLNTDKTTYYPENYVKLSWTINDQSDIWYKRIELYKNDSFIDSIYDSRSSSLTNVTLTSENSLSWLIPKTIQTNDSYYFVMEAVDQSFLRNTAIVQSKNIEIIPEEKPLTLSLKSDRTEIKETEFIKIKAFASYNGTPIFKWKAVDGTVYPQNNPSHAPNIVLWYPPDVQLEQAFSIECILTEDHSQNFDKKTVQVRVLPDNNDPVDCQYNDCIAPVVSNVELSSTSIDLNQDITIFWGATDNQTKSDQLIIKIEYYDGNQWKLLKNNLQNTGKHTWKPDRAGEGMKIRVSAIDNAQKIGSNTSREFSVKEISDCPQITEKPVFHNIISPVTNNFFTIQWNKISNATGYILKESDKLNFTEALEISYDGYDNTSVSMTNKAGGAYYYQVRAVNNCGNKSIRSSWMKVYVNTPPEKPYNPTPQDRAVCKTRTPELRWHSKDVEGDVDYSVLLGTSSDNLSVLQRFNSSDNAYTSNLDITRPLQANTKYYWQVKAKDSSNVIVKGPIWWFKIENITPDLQVTVFDISGLIEKGKTVTAKVRISNNGNFSAGAADLFFYYSRNQEELIPLSTGQHVPELESGASISLQEEIKIKNLFSGTSYFIAKVDNLGLFIENDLQNNQKIYQLNLNDIEDPVINNFEFQWPKDNKYYRDRNYYISFNIDDNTEIESVDLFYSTDNGVSWKDIEQNIPVKNEGTESSPWKIPSDTPLNNTFKLKITVKDTSANYSEKVIGPYEVIDSAFPELIITSPKKGDIWQINSTKDIKWTLTGNVGISGIRLWYQNGSKLNEIESLDYTVQDFSSGLFSWTITNDVGVSSDVKIMFEVTGTNLKEISIFSDSFSVVDNSEEPQAPWHKPEMLLNNTNDQFYQEDLSILIDDYNAMHLVYIGGYHDVGNRGLFYRKRTSSGIWIESNTIYSYSSEYLTHLKLAVDSSNNPHVIWLSDNDETIYYSKYNGNSWTSPVNISSSGLEPYYCDIEIDTNDNIHVAFEGNDSVFYVQSNSGMWSSPVRLVQHESFPVNIGITHDDHIIIIYNNQELKKFYAIIKKDSNTWSTPVELSSSSRASADLFSTDQGTHIIIPYEKSLKRLVDYFYYDGESWQSESILEGENFFLKVDLCVSSNNSPQLIWREDTSPDSLFYMQKLSTGWSNKVKINMDSGPPNFEYFSSSMSSDDKLSVVWAGGNGSNSDIYYNSAYITDNTGPKISVTYPESGASLSPGSTCNIKWTATDDSSVENISIKYSTDDGHSFTVIENKLQNTGNYQWEVPNIETDTGKIYITAIDGSGNDSVTASNHFSIIDRDGPVINIISPKGGEVWTGSTQQSIIWNADDSNNIPTTLIYYSLDDGKTWLHETDVEINETEYIWTIPEKASDTVKIKIVAYDNHKNMGTSISNSFQIYVLSSLMPPHSPDPPDNLTIKTSNNTLSWQVINETQQSLKYNVYFGTTSPPEIVSESHIYTSFSPILSEDMVYYWKVESLDGKQVKSSPIWSFNTNNIIRINPPEIQGASNITSSGIYLTWTDHSENETGFTIERKTGINGSYSEIASVEENSIIYQDNSISANTAYFYRLKAFNNDNIESDYSAEYFVLSENDHPDTPSNPTIIYFDDPLSAKLEWTANDINGDNISFDIYFGNTPNPPLLSSSSSFACFTTTSLEYNQLYFWKIVVKDEFNAKAEGPVWFFKTKAMPIPEAPSLLTLKSIQADTVEIEWCDNSTNETGFIIERKGGKNDFSIIQITGDTSFTDIIDPNIEYFYRVKSYNSSGHSEIYSNELKVVNSVHFDVTGNPADATWTVYIENATIDDNPLETGDEIAVFDGKKLVGAFKVSQPLSSETVFDNYITVWSTLNNGPGYQKGNKATFKCWDFSEKKLFTGKAIFNSSNEDAYTRDLFPFEDGEYSIVSLMFYSEKIQTISLTEGYQLISFNVDLQGTSITVFSEIFSCLEFVRDTNGNMFRKIGLQWIDNIENIYIGQGYLVKMHCPAVLNVKGKPVDTQIPVNLSSSGYHLVGYLPENNFTGIEAFDSILDQLEFARNTKGNMLRKIGDTWIDNIENIFPGEGFLLKMNAGGMLIYPISQ